MRYKGSGTEHYLGHAGGRRRAQLRQYVRRRNLRISPLSLVIVGLLAGCANAPFSASDTKVSQPVSETDALGYGAYLSGRFAASEHDMSDAAKFYNDSLARDPSDPTLLALTFFYATSSGEIDDAAKLAK